MTPDPDQAAEDLRPLLVSVLPPDWERAVAARDQAALTEATRRAWEVVYHRTLLSIRDRREAEEVTQEVFCRVLARLGTRQGDEAVRQAYLVQASRNLLADRWRRRARAQAAPPMVAPAPPTPEEAALARLEVEDLRRALAALPDEQRTVLRLRVFEHLSAEETGAVLGRSAAAVRQIQHRAVVALRAALGGEGRG